MKDKVAKIGTISLILCLMIINFVTVNHINIRSVSTDSGWDTSYDSGSSWSSSSSWDSGGSSSSDWGSSSRSSGSSGSINYNLTKEERKIVLLIFGSVFTIPVIIYIIANIIERRKYINKKSIEVMDKTFSDTELMIYEKFVTIQKDWMNFNYEGLRKNLTDELYNQYEMQLNILASKGEKNIMDEFRLIDCQVSKPKVENDIEHITVEITVAFVDYVIDKDEKVVRGHKYTTNYMTYNLKFIKKKNKAINCPKCGAPIGDNVGNKCLYCHATMQIYYDDWVMSNKKLIKQR